MAQNISKKFSHVGENIKKIRQAKHISQAEFSALFNLSRPSVGAYEEGRSEPKIDTIIQIANHFRISIDLLLTRKLTVSEIYSFDLLNEKLDKAHKLEKEDKLPPQQPNSQGIGLVKESDYLNYIVNHNTSDFIKKLPQIQLPVQPSNLYRAFEMNGSEMEYHQQGLHHGDILMGEKIESHDLKSHVGKTVTVVHKSNITTRRLDEVSKDEITLIADDPNYPGVHLKREEVHEVWGIRSVYSTYLNPPTLLEERVLKIEKELEAMKKSSP